MQRAYFASLALFLGLAAQACADDDVDGEDPATAGVCTPGDAGCPCGQGDACQVGLMCVSHTCVAPSTDGSTGGAGDDGLCMDNDACASDELCYGGACVLIDDLLFDVAVYGFEPPSCADGWGEAELYFDYFLGGELVSSSSISACPGSWWDEPVLYDPLRSFELDFWESDALSDDHITGLCWGAGTCEAVPDWILREGWWEDTDSTGEYLYSIEFRPTL